MSDVPPNFAGDRVVLHERISATLGQNEQDTATSVSVWHAPSDTLLVAHEPDRIHSAASINKLPIVLVLRDAGADLDNKLNWSTADIHPGQGPYDWLGDDSRDHIPPQQATIGALAASTLRDSSNTAPRVLVNTVLGGAETVNHHFITDHEVVHTQLQSQADGRFFMGNTTSREALHLVKSLLAESPDTALDELIRTALASNIFITEGVRSQLVYRDKRVLTSKLGLLEATEEDELHRYHDVGGIWTPPGKDQPNELLLCYAILTTGPNLQTARQAVKTMGQAMLHFAAV